MKTYLPNCPVCNKKVGLKQYTAKSITYYYIECISYACRWDYKITTNHYQTNLKSALDEWFKLCKRKFKK